MEIRRVRRPSTLSNNQLRYAAYHCFTSWYTTTPFPQPLYETIHRCYGKLNTGERVEIPFCCVTAIRRAFPSSSYTGFIASNDMDEDGNVD